MKTIKNLSVLMLSLAFLLTVACSTPTKSTEAEVVEEAPEETMEAVVDTAAVEMDVDSAAMEMDSVSVEADTTAM